VALRKHCDVRDGQLQRADALLLGHQACRSARGARGARRRVSAVRAGQPAHAAWLLHAAASKGARKGQCHESNRQTGLAVCLASSVQILEFGVSAPPREGAEN
jgi:hypothetical protein